MGDLRRGLGVHARARSHAVVRARADRVSASRDGSYLVKAQDWKTLVEVFDALEMTKGVKLKIQVDPARV